jgi:hypothetical protein
MWGSNEAQLRIAVLEVYANFDRANQHRASRNEFTDGAEDSFEVDHFRSVNEEPE